MFSLVYVSSAIRPFSDTELDDLLHLARTRNSVHGITGMLVYRGGNFVQAIEGELEPLNDLMDRISVDTRHHSVRILLRETIEAPRFPDWSMGFFKPDASEAEAIPGYLKLIRGNDAQWTEFAADPARTKRLLASLARHI